MSGHTESRPLTLSPSLDLRSIEKLAVELADVKPIDDRVARAIVEAEYAELAGRLPPSHPSRAMTPAGAPDVVNVVDPSLYDLGRGEIPAGEHRNRGERGCRRAAFGIAARVATELARRSRSSVFPIASFERRIGSAQRAVGLRSRHAVNSANAVPNTRHMLTGVLAGAFGRRMVAAGFVVLAQLGRTSVTPASRPRSRYG